MLSEILSQNADRLQEGEEQSRSGRCLGKAIIAMEVGGAAPTGTAHSSVGVHHPS